MKKYRVVLYITFNIKDGITEGKRFINYYKAKDLQELDKKINKFLDKLYSFKDMNYYCEGFDIKEVNKKIEEEQDEYEKIDG